MCSSDLSSSETDDLAETIAGKVASKMPTPKVVQTAPREPSTMLQSIGSVNTKLDTAISGIENLKEMIEKQTKSPVSLIRRYIHWVLPAVTALAAFVISWCAYHNSYHYWGERFHKLTNDPMQTEQPLLDLKYNSIEMIKIEFEGGRKQKAKDTIKNAESRLRKHKRAVKKAERKRKRQARKAGGTDHAK